MKTRWMAILLIVLSLLACTGCRGQSEPATPQETAAPAKEEQTTDFSLQSAVFKGNDKTDNNPWGFLAGMIESEDYGLCVFLTPNTSAAFAAPVSSKIVLEYRIHPWISDLSDGAGLLIWIVDAEDNILSENEISVDPASEWQTLTVDLSSHENAAGFKLLCNNGANDNDDGDWVIVREHD